MKQLILSFLLVFCFYGSYAQFTLDEIKSLELGQKFEDAEQMIRSRLGNNLSVLEGDTLETYKIESPKNDSIWILKTQRPSFDGYGNCRYSFKFAKDVLIGVDIRFEFLAKEEGKENFARLLRQINANFSEDQEFHSLKTSGDELNIDRIVNEVENNCDAKDDNESYAQQSAFMGIRAWEIHRRVNNVPRHKFLTLQVQKAAMKSLPYSGCIAVVEMSICNEAFIELYNNVNEMKIKYESLPGE